MTTPIPSNGSIWLHPNGERRVVDVTRPSAMGGEVHWHPCPNPNDDWWWTPLCLWRSWIESGAKEISNANSH